jgi:hypothetical protein
MNQVVVQRLPLVQHSVKCHDGGDRLKSWSMRVAAIAFEGEEVGDLSMVWTKVRRRRGRAR